MKEFDMVECALLVNVINAVTFGLELFNSFQNNSHSSNGLFVLFLVAQIA